MQTNGDCERAKFPADLQPRSFPEGRHEFLRYQLGRKVAETRYERGEPYTVLLFQLIGFGSTWEAATDMALERLGLMPRPQLTVEDFHN